MGVKATRNCYNLAMTPRIVFADIDGTLLTSDHKLPINTKKAIFELKEKGIPFIIVSARPAIGIFPILDENGFSCPIVAFSGGMMVDEKRNIVYSETFPLAKAKEIIEASKEFGEDATWNIYSTERWYVLDTSNARVREEADIVSAEPDETLLEDIPEDLKVNKVMLMVNPSRMEEIENKMKRIFSDLTIARSCDHLLEFNLNVNKAVAVHRCCDYFGVDVSSSVAFGDNYTDMPMLEAAGMAFLMGNAPEELKKRFPNVTLDNDHDGVYVALKKLHLVV